MTSAVRTETLTEALTDVLTALGDRVAPVSMALERTLPLTVECTELFAEGGLVRGRTLSCVGPAATTVALRLVAAAIEAGSWMAIIDVPTLGLDAACELGVVLERVVSIGTDEPGQWAEVVAAAADGFDVVLTCVPDEVRPATLRKVATRLQQRGVVMLVVGDPGPLVCDGVIETGRQMWRGIGAGWGHLGQRSFDVVATGRRLPGQRRRTMEFPTVEPVERRLGEVVEPVLHELSPAS